MDEIKQDLSQICGCNAEDIFVTASDDGLLARIVVPVPSGRRRDRLIAGRDAAALAREAQAQADRIRAMHGRAGEVIDTDAIEGGEDNPRPRKGPSLRERIEALEAIAGRGGARGSG